MKPLKPLFWGFLTLLALLLPACSLQQHKINGLSDSLHQGNIKAVLAQVESAAHPERDFVQYRLNTGLLKAYSGDFPGAIADLQKAKKVIKALQATSVSETVGASTVNETLRSYIGTPSERMLLQQLLILCYLMENDLNGARVEVLQAQTLEKTLPDEGLSGLVASTDFLAGLVYQLGQEPDNAMISYRNAYKIMLKSKLPVPKALKNNLLHLTQQLGLDNEHAGYVKRFGYDVPVRSRPMAQLAIIDWAGVVSHKKQRFMSVYVPKLEQNVSLALPYYPSYYPSAQPMQYRIGDRFEKTHRIDDINQLVRADLKADSDSIYAASLARVISKYLVVNEAKKKDSSGVLGIIMNVATTVLEVADVRSWNMLPASVQIALIDVPVGDYRLQQPSVNGELALIHSGEHGAVKKPSVDNSRITRANGGNLQAPRLTKEKNIHLAAGKTLLLFYPSVSKTVYSYMEQ